MTSSLGTKIRELRILSGMSQEELGKRIGVQRAAIQKYEKGSVTNVPLSTIERIAGVFDVSPTYLVGWTNEKTNPLAAEVRVLQGVKNFYGSDGVDLLECYTNINSKGKRKLIQYAHDMSLIHDANL